MEHLTITANGADFHLVRAGSGKPLLCCMVGRSSG
ncbi:hypothetical protein ACVIJW_006044 [Bradyrhizobium barranii subsp. barranii]